MLSVLFSSAFLFSFFTCVADFSLLLISCSLCVLLLQRILVRLACCLLGARYISVYGWFACAWVVFLTLRVCGIWAMLAIGPFCCLYIRCRSSRSACGVLGLKVSVPGCVTLLSVLVLRAICHVLVEGYVVPCCAPASSGLAVVLLRSPLSLSSSFAFLGWFLARLLGLPPRCVLLHYSVLCCYPCKFFLPYGWFRFLW